MTIPYFQIILLIVAVISIAACAPVSTSTSLSPTVVLRTPTGLPTASPSPQPTYAATAMPTSQPVTGETQIRVIIGDTVLTGRLLDNATARDLISQLPLTLTFSDFNQQEKIASLPRKLSTEGAPPGDDPFPNYIGYFNGIVRIGQFDGRMGALTSQTDDFTARIELAQ